MSEPTMMEAIRTPFGRRGGAFRKLRPDMDRINPWGCAIVRGHPHGATGGGLTTRMVAGLETTEGQVGLQVMCVGHGIATATIGERIHN